MPLMRSVLLKASAVRPASISCCAISIPPRCAVPAFAGTQRCEMVSPSRTLCDGSLRSEEHTSELQSLMRISYAVFCLKKKKKETKQPYTRHNSTHTIPEY